MAQVWMFSTDEMTACIARFSVYYPDQHVINQSIRCKDVLKYQHMQINPSLLSGVTTALFWPADFRRNCPKDSTRLSHVQFRILHTKREHGTVDGDGGGRYTGAIEPMTATNSSPHRIFSVTLVIACIFDSGIAGRSTSYPRENFEISKSRQKLEWLAPLTTPACSDEPGFK